MSKGVTLDLNRITLGNILSILTMLSSLWYASVKFGSDIAVIKNDVAWLKQAMLTRIPPPTVASLEK